MDELPHLAFDHDKIFAEAMERLRRDIHFQPVGFDLLDDEFTIPDLQRLYEAILGVKFDRRNFQRKILSSGILEQTADEGSARVAFSMTRSPRKEARLEEPVMLADTCYEDSFSEVLPVMESPREKKGRPGRVGSFFRLNRRKYEELKEDGLKQEF